ncbi:MAG TPA: AAA family ATPase [Solirubrobacteraceae bacterium]|jgi:DNA-binding CsgD family transcriptional regulator
MFVGRARELAALERALEAARAGRGAAVIVAGEAGIGKTRLVSELSARAAGFEVLVGRCLDLIGTELPYQPVAEALGGLPERDAGSQLRVFETILEKLDERAPALLVLEDLHWADASTLDLVVFLAHNLHDRAVVLLGTYRADEPASAESMRRLAEAVRRSAAAQAVELGPLAPEELAALLTARGGARALTDAIVARSEGNPFFAEELFAAGEGALPRGLRELLLRRVARLDEPTQGLLRVAAAAGRDVPYALLRDTAALPEDAVRESLRAAVDHAVLVADQAAGSFGFRHALLAEAVYATILPGEREALHARLAEQLAGRAAAAELAPHWAAAGHAAEALEASVAAAREAAAVFGLAEALGHLERALALWDEVPDAEARAGLDLAALCSWAAGLAGHVGTAPRAVELAERAIELLGPEDRRRASRLHVDLGEYLYATGRDDPALAALARAVELVPPEPPSPERAFALGSLAGGLMMAGRRAESLALAEQALALAREAGAGPAEVRAVTVIGGDLAYLGRAEEGLAHFRDAVRLAEEIGDHLGLARAYTNLTDALTMLGRYRESAGVAREGLEAMDRYGISEALLIANGIEALVAIGEWDEADRLSAGALRRITSSFPYWLLAIRADVEIGRGELDAARAHLEAARATLREDHVFGLYDAYVAELALWERRWTDADAAVHDALAQARGAPEPIRLQLCAKGLRAQAELAALARARRDAEGLRDRLDRARALRAQAREAARGGSPVTPAAAGWHAVAEAEYERAHGAARPDLWAAAADTWDRLDHPPLAAYCRWRQAEALATAGAPRAEAAAPARQAYAVARRLGARPLQRELELLAERARLDLEPLPGGPPPDGLADQLGLTPRESEVLALVARGLTNREIAATLVISVKTASVHVSHILRKLDAPNRLEAAAIAHRLPAPRLDLPRSRGDQRAPSGAAPA